jgi:hypothetical protein
MSNDAIAWLKKQYSITIVQEAGQTRVGVATATPTGVSYRWNSGSDLESAIKVAIGLDNGGRPMVPLS